MNGKYITTSEVESFLEITGEKALVSQLIMLAEGMVDQYLDGYDFSTKTVTGERHDYNGSGPYYLNYTPVAITEAGGTSVSWTEGVDYVQDGRRIMFSSAVSLENYNNDTFNFIEFTYTKSNVVPENVKLALLQLIGAMYTQRKMHGVSSFSQGDLSITFGDAGFGASKDQITSVKNLLAPYRRVNIVS